jgi:hypothetical protein
VSGDMVPMEVASALLDEIYMLRRAAAYEARAVEAQTLDLKALGKGRRKQIEGIVGRLRECARGNVGYSYAGKSSQSLTQSYRDAGGDEVLNLPRWMEDKPWLSR